MRQETNMEQRIIVHLVRAAGDPQDYLGADVHLDATGEELGVMQEAIKNVLAGEARSISGWDQDGDWVTIPSRSIAAITLQGFERPV